jgi:hypothetical protein
MRFGSRGVVIRLTNIVVSGERGGMATKKSKKTTKKAPARRAGAKKAAAARAGRGSGGVNKSAFIRDQPETMSAKAVVEAAAAQGIDLTEGFVYNVRSNAKSKSGRKPTAKAGRRAVAAGATPDESAFRRLVVALGTTRARALVAEVEEKLAAVIAGR